MADINDSGLSIEIYSWDNNEIPVAVLSMLPPPTPIHAELGTLLFEIAQLLFALERTLFLRAKVRLNQMSEEWQANGQNPILSGPLMSDLEKRRVTVRT